MQRSIMIHKEALIMSIYPHVENFDRGRFSEFKILFEEPKNCIEILLRPLVCTHYY
jgi:hypothetical protein